MPRRRFQRGRVFQRGQKPKWVGSFREDSIQPDGTIRRIQRTVVLGDVKSMSKRAALKALQPYLDRVNDPIMLPPRRGITLEKFADEWRATVAVNLKPATVRSVEYHLRGHILPRLGKLTLSEIDTRAVQAFVAEVSQGRSPRTVRDVVVTLISLLRKARAWKYPAAEISLRDLTLPRPGIRAEARCFTDEEVGRMIAAASEPFATILAVTSLLGLRIGETLALRVSDLDFNRKIVRVRQSVDAVTRTIQSVKSIASAADLPMPSRLETRLRKHLETHNGSDLLFVNKEGRPYSSRKLREKRLQPLLKKLGIERGGFHGLRHGTASALLHYGVTPAVAQRQLRHSDPRITLGIYGHVIGDAQREAVEYRSTRIAEYAN